MILNSVKLLFSLKAHPDSIGACKENSRSCRNALDAYPL